MDTAFSFILNVAIFQPPKNMHVVALNKLHYVLFFI